MSYSAIFDKNVPVEYIRIGPFNTSDINVDNKEFEVKKIQDRYFAYVKV